MKKPVASNASAPSHIVSFIEDYINEYWPVLRHAQFKDPAFGFLVAIAKARRGDDEHELLR